MISYLIPFLMEEPADNTTETLPIASSSQEIELKSNPEEHPRKIIVGLVTITTLFVVILIALSLTALGTIQDYRGSLSPYLPIRSGEIEYSRVPEEYWEHRIQMIKAMGMNSVSVYVMWNHHQIAQGSFDFNSTNKNLTKFLELTQKYGLNVLLRPGPYVCAEWDFGGLPARLLGIQGMEIRSTNALYEAEVKIYFSALAPVIKPFLSSNGGNIILLQLENQYGYFGKDNQHILNLKQMWEDLQIECQFYLEDPGAFWKVSYIPGAHLGFSETSFLLRYVDIQLSSMRDQNTLVFAGEIYSGWFTQWGFSWGGVTTETISYSVQTLINYNRSFSLYMIFGGTNFGVTAGANGFNGYYQYLPHITSYDYDSPITEQGQPTPKYFSLRSVLQSFQNTSLPDIPEAKPTITIQEFTLQIQGYLWSNLPDPVLQDSDLTFFQSPLLQMYNQGIVIYETYLAEKRNYKFRITYHDLAMIFIDDQIVTTLVRTTKDTETFQINCAEGGCLLRILVEAMGHINFGQSQTLDRKGLLSFQQVGSDQVYRWNIYKVPVHDNSALLQWNSTEATLTFPVLYSAELTLTQLGDTYLDMSSFTKGYIYVNDHLLGRYWNKGPQKRLFCPGVWLKEGINRIKVLEFMEGQNRSIRGVIGLRE